MDKKILIISFFIILIILSAGCIRKPSATIPVECGNGICEAGENKNNCPADCKTQEDPCAEAPQEANAWCIETNTWLDQKLIVWKPKEHRQMTFVGLIQPQFAEVFDDNTILNYIDSVESAGVDTISIYLTSLWASDEQKYYRLFEKIKDDNKKLYIAFQAKNEIKPTWDEYTQFELSTIDKIVPAYKPDYFGIVIEPETAERYAQLGEIPASDWKQLIADSASRIKQHNPSTKTIIAAASNEREIKIIRESMTLNDIDIIGINVYGYRAPEMFEELIDEAHKNNKEVWITETWPVFANTDHVWMKKTNDKWIKAMEFYSQHKEMTGMSPWFTRYFFTYADNDDFRTGFPEALKNKERTSTFYAYKDIIEK